MEKVWSWTVMMDRTFKEAGISTEGWCEVITDVLKTLVADGKCLELDSDDGGVTMPGMVLSVSQVVIFFFFLR
jgi:hypothetical protein